MLDDLDNLLQRQDMPEELMVKLLDREDIKVSDLKELLNIGGMSPKLLLEVLKKEDDIPITAIKSSYCFVAGTTISTSAGERVIESLIVGDSVIACEPESGVIQNCLVLQKFEREVFVVLDLQIGSTEIIWGACHFWKSLAKVQE